MTGREEISVRTRGYVRKKKESNRISSTFQAIYDIKRGGKGPWAIQLSPHFESLPNVDTSLKYGCVLTIESTKNADIYAEVSKWASRTAAVIRQPEVLHVYK